MTNHSALRVFNLSPGTVIADDGDDGQLLAYHALELHAVEAKGAIAVQDQDLLARTSKLGCHSEAGTCAQAAHGTGIEPVTRFVDVNHPTAVADDIATVAYDRGILVDKVADLAAETHGMNGYSIVIHQGSITLHSLAFLPRDPRLYRRGYHGRR